MRISWPDALVDRRQVGGKAAALCAVAASFDVPAFFCVAATTLKAWEAAIAEPEWLAALSEAYRRLGDGAELAVAVRSSAVDEDGEAASFAGQYETVLNVVGLPALVDAVSRCLRSAVSAPARAYRTSPDAAMAVIVQRQVRADAAAIAFSVDPTTGARDAVLINAVWGLGEGAVGGIISPDTFLVSRAGLAAGAPSVRAALSDKASMVVATDRGTATVQVPESLRRYPCLTRSQVQRIAALTLALEERQGHPVDVECAVSADRVELLQCRPITTLRADVRRQ